MLTVTGVLIKEICDSILHKDSEDNPMAGTYEHNMYQI